MNPHLSSITKPLAPRLLSKAIILSSLLFTKARLRKILLKEHAAYLTPGLDCATENLAQKRSVFTETCCFVYTVTGGQYSEWSFHTRILLAAGMLAEGPTSLSDLAHPPLHLNTTAARAEQICFLQKNYFLFCS